MINQFTNTKSRNLREWVEIYKNKTGEDVLLPKGFVMYWLPERGFAQMKVDVEGSILMIHMMCGDIRFWLDMAKLMCMQNNIDHISSICTRTIESYIRIFNWQVVEEFNKDGFKRFICRDSAGCKVMISPKGVDENSGEVSYWVTQYLKERL